MRGSHQINVEFDEPKCLDRISNATINIFESLQIPQDFISDSALITKISRWFRCALGNEEGDRGVCCIQEGSGVPRCRVGASCSPAPTGHGAAGGPPHDLSPNLQHHSSLISADRLLSALTHRTYHNMNQHHTLTYICCVVGCSRRDGGNGIGF